MDKIKASWMFEELILLLLKEKKYDEAIKKYVDKEKFQDAEDFCIQHKNLGLLTTLLTIYFDSYEMYTRDSERYKE